MDTIRFLETIVHLHSDRHYHILDTRKTCGGPSFSFSKIILSPLVATSYIGPMAQR
jgi:hypothetical protein